MEKWTNKQKTKLIPTHLTERYLHTITVIIRVIDHLLNPLLSSPWIMNENKQFNFKMKEELEVAVDIVSLTILFKEGKSAIKLQLESPPSPTSTATPLTSAASAPAPGGRRHAFGEAACTIICQPQLGRSTSSPTLHHHLLQDLGRGRCHCASPLHHHHHLYAPPHNHLRTTL